MDGHTVLPGRSVPNDGFRDSIARAIREKARSSHESNPDAPGADRHLMACDQLAAHIEGLPLWDSRFRILLQVAKDSDAFSIAGNGARLIQLLGLDFPAPPDTDAVFTEFVIESASDLTRADTGEAEKAALREAFEAERSKDQERIRDLQDEVKGLEDARAADSQELSDMRGRLQRLDGGEVETLSRQVASLEGELDQANARAAAKARECHAAYVRIESLTAELAEKKPAPKAKRAKKTPATATAGGN